MAAHLMHFKRKGTARHVEKVGRWAQQALVSHSRTRPALHVGRAYHPQLTYFFRFFLKHTSTTYDGLQGSMLLCT